MWALLTVMATSTNAVAQGLALFWLLVLAGVLRPAHLQRSKLMKLWPHSLEGQCTADKKRIDGKRRAFLWRAPRISLLGTDFGEQAFNFWIKATGGELSFFLPDTAPKGSGLDAKAWSNGPMGQSKIRSLTNVFFEAITKRKPEATTRALFGKEGIAYPGTPHEVCAR